MIDRYTRDKRASLFMLGAALAIICFLWFAKDVGQFKPAVLFLGAICGVAMMSRAVRIK